MSAPILTRRRKRFWASPIELELLTAVLGNTDISDRALELLLADVLASGRGARRLSFVANALNSGRRLEQLADALRKADPRVLLPTWDRHLATVREITAVAHEIGSEVRFIKGVALAHLPPWNRAVRAMGDVDVLVPDRDVAAYLSRLRQAGWRPVYADRPIHLLLKYERSIDLIRNDQGLDLHWDLSDRLRQFTRGPAATIWQRPGPFVKLPSSDMTVETIEPELQFLQLATKARQRESIKALPLQLDAASLLLHERVRPEVLLHLAFVSSSMTAVVDLLSHAADACALPPELGALVQTSPRARLRYEGVIQRLAGPESRFSGWPPDWIASFLEQIERLPTRRGDCARFCDYVLGRRFGRERGRLGGGRWTT